MASRGRKSNLGSLPECRRKRHVLGEKRDPKSIIQEEKKGTAGLMIVFMEIQPLTRFGGEAMTRRKRRVSAYNAGVT